MPINKQILIKVRQKAGENKAVAEAIEKLLNGADESKQLKRIIDNFLKKI